MILFSWLSKLRQGPRRSRLQASRRTAVEVPVQERGRKFAKFVEEFESRRVLTHVPTVTFTVNTLADTVDVAPGDGNAADGAGNTSLRAAIQEANVATTDVIIVLGANTYTLTRAGDLEDQAVDGDLDITNTNRHITIRGASGGGTTIDANLLDRALHVLSEAQLTLEDLTITNGRATSATNKLGGALLNQGSLQGYNLTFSNNEATEDGGAVLTFGGSDTTFESVTFSNNKTQTVGGAIANGGALSISNGSFLSNQAGTGGGAVENTSTGTLTVVTSLFDNNTLTGAGSGGAIRNLGQAAIRYSSFTNQFAPFGGGVAVLMGSALIDSSSFSFNDADEGAAIGLQDGALELVNSTIGNNIAGGTIGGAIRADLGSLTIRHTTIFGNDATNGDTGGVSLGGSATARVSYTIIAGNTASGVTPDVSGSFVSLGSNFIGDSSGSTGFVSGTNFDQVGSGASPLDPQLGVLQNNGGPTATFLPQAGSSVIDAGDPASTPFPVRDQRGATRANGISVPMIDIGAVETDFEGFFVNTFADTVDVNPGDGVAVDASGKTSLRAAIMEANALVGKQHIVVHPGDYALTITGADENGGATGDLDLFGEIDLFGFSADSTDIDGQGLDRVLHLLGADVTIGSLTIAGGKVLSGSGGGVLNAGDNNVLRDVFIENNTASDFGGGVASTADNLQIEQSTISNNMVAGDGGGVGSSKPTTLRNVVIEDNIASANGGGLAVTGNVTVLGGAIRNNEADGKGGGVSITSNALLSAFDASFSGNMSKASGGGISADKASVQLARSTVIGNQSQDDGGGLWLNGAAQLVGVMIKDNTATNDGGGLSVTGNRVEVRASEIATNSAANGGGLLINAGAVVTLSQATVAENTATNGGGGIRSQGTLNVTNSTISSNVADVSNNGGGIEALGGELSIASSTITDNTAGTGGGVHVGFGVTAASVQNTIIANNSATVAGDDVSNSRSNISLGHNIVGVASTGFANGVNNDQVGTPASPLDPLLISLNNNGGPTRTHALQAASPARNAGNGALAPAVDQRGVARVGGSITDVGAFYAGSTAIFVTTTSDIVDAGDGVMSLREAILQANATPSDEQIVLSPGLYDIALSGDREGLALTGDFDIADPRLNFVDTSYGTGGTASVNVGATAIVPALKAITRQSDGKIVAVGADENDFKIVRFNADGTLDNTFGSSGIATLNFDGFRDVAEDVAFDSSGNIIVAGWRTDAAGDVAFAVARFTSNGTLDTTFNGSSGFNVIDFDAGVETSKARSVTIDPNGKIVVAGSRDTGTLAIALARLNSDGTLDSGFGTSGKVLTNTGGIPAQANAVITRATGGYAIAGFIGGDAAVVTYENDGSEGVSFGVDGVATIMFGSGSSTATSIAERPDGRFLVAGHDAANYGVVLLNDRGMLDSSFGTRLVSANGLAHQAGQLALLDDGRFALAATEGDDARLLRFNRDGELEFSTTRTSTDPVFGLDVVGSGSELFFATSDPQNNDFEVTRFANTGNGGLSIYGFDPLGTTIDAHQLDRLFDVQPNARVALEGVQLINGQATNVIGIDGGAIRGLNAMISLQSVTLSNNKAAGMGGAIAMSRSANGTAGLSLEESEFRNNQAAGGGAVFTDRVMLNVERTTFQSNTTTAFSGGAIAHVGANISIAQSHFANNSATSIGSLGGGAFIADGNSGSTVNVLISETIFHQNSSSDEGGGGLALSGPNLDATISRSEFTENFSVGGGPGGGVQIDGGNVSIALSRFFDNESISGTNEGLGGGLAVKSGTVNVNQSEFVNNTVDGYGGAVFSNGALTISSSTFAGNQARFGGAFFEFAGSANITNSTFSGNSAIEIGGGLYVDDGSASLLNITAANNVAGTTAGGLYRDPISSSTVTSQNSLIANNTAPAFVDYEGTLVSLDGNLIGDADGQTHFNGTSDIVGGLATTTISDATNSSPVVVTSSSHGLATGDRVRVRGVTGNTGANGVFFVRVLDSISFELVGSIGTGSYTGGGSVTLLVNPRLGDLRDNTTNALPPSSSGPLPEFFRSPFVPFQLPIAVVPQTHALQFGSPAIDSGINTGAPSSDQRGVARPQDALDDGASIVDIGAFERRDADVAGAVFIDINGNGIRDAGDGLLNTEIGFVYLDTNRNGLFDGDEPIAQQRSDDPVTPQDESGYIIGFVPPGTESYIGVSLPSNRRITTPTDLLLALQSATSFDVNAAPEAIATGDINGDGIADVVVALSNLSVVAIVQSRPVNPGGSSGLTLGGSGSGFEYDNPVFVPVGNTPSDIKLADFNGDNIRDIVVVNRNDDSITILEGGSFAVLASISTGDGPRDVEIADFNSDGKLDLIVAETAANQVRFIPQVAALAFDTGTVIATGNGPRDVALGDFNRDNMLDVVVAFELDDTIKFVTQTGSGGFATKTFNLPAGSAPQSLVVSDVDLDGDVDFVIGEVGGDTVRLLRSIGDFTSIQSVSLGTFSSPGTIKAADLNGDRLPEILIASEDSSGALHVIPNLGSLFATPLVISSTLSSPSAFALADTTGDGRTDIVLANRGADEILTFSNLTGDIRLNPATGDFIDFQNIGTQELRTLAGTVFNDVDANGTQDVGETGQGNVTVYLDLNHNGRLDPHEPTAISQNGDSLGQVTFVNVIPGDYRLAEVVPFNHAQTSPGTLALHQVSFTDFASSRTVDVLSVDVNNDNEVDVVTLDRGLSNGSIRVRLGTSTTEFVLLPAVAIGENPGKLAAADFDNDGDLDFAVTEQGLNRIQLLTNDGTGTLSLGSTLAANVAPDEVVFADLDRDEDLDLVVSHPGGADSGKLRFYTNDGTGSFNGGTDFDTGAAVTGFTLGDINNDALPDLVVSHGSTQQVQLYRNTFSGFLSAGTLTFGGVEEPASVVLRQVDGRLGPELFVLVDRDSDGALSVFRSDGGFNFTNVATKTLSNQLSDLVLGDFDDDHELDVVVTNTSASPSVEVLLGTGNLSFANAVVLATSHPAEAIAVGDFDGDKRPDLAVAEGNVSTGELRLLFNRVGSQLLNVPVSGSSFFAVGNIELGTIAGTVFNDLDRNNVLDGSDVGLSGVTVFIDSNDNGVRDPGEPFDVTKSSGGYTLSGVFPNTAQRVTVERPSGFHFSIAPALSFNDNFPYALGLAPSSITITDFGNDGDQDGVVTNFDSDTVSFLVNTNGTYVTPEFAVGDGPQDAAVADVNGDGLLDVVVANGLGNSISVLLGLAVGGFSAPSQFTVGASPSEIVLGDFNGDLQADVMVALANDDQVRILINDGNGAFSIFTTVNVGDEPRGLVAVDLNADGKLDFATSNVLGADATIALNQGGGTFATTSVAAGANPDTIRAADINKDGDIDVLVSNRTGDSITVLSNDGTGTFTAAAPLTFFAGSQPLGFDLGDYDNDGDLDLAVVLDNADTITLYENDGAGAFVLDDTLSAGLGNELVFTDINRDGDLDIVTIDTGSNTLLVRRNISATNTVFVPTGATVAPNFALAFTQNQAPTLTAPSSESTDEDAPIVFSGANGNAITINDADAATAPLRVILRATNGTLTLSGTAGLSFSIGDGTADGTLSMVGSLVDLNAALDGLIFTPHIEFAGSAALQIDVDDLGNSGTGANGLVSQSINIAVAASPADYGDAPAVYPQLAHHDLGGPSLGAAPDQDAAAFPSANADGDDTDNTDDEDGVIFLSSIVTSSSTNNLASMLVNLQGASSAKLDAFIDFDRDGSWDDPGEQISTSVSLTAGDNLLNFVVPAGASVGSTFARFRVSSTGGLNSAAAANDGEVEDYAVTITDDTANATVVLPAGGGRTTLSIDSGNRVLARGGVNFFRIPNASGSKISVSGTTADDDELLIDFSNGNPISLGGVSFDGGGGGNDSLVISGGSADSITHRFINASDGSVQIGISVDTFVVDYLGLEPIMDDLLATDRVFEFSSSSEAISLNDAGLSAMTIDSTVGESVTFVNPSSSLSIRGGAGNDLIDLDGINDDYAGSLSVDGEGGNDTVSFNSVTSLNSINVTSESIAFATSAISTANTQTYNGAMTLQSDITFADAVSSTITFNGTLDGAKNLTTIGAAVFNGVVGGTTPLSKAQLTGDFKNVTINQDFTVGSGGISSSNINKLTVAGKLSSDASGIILSAFDNITFLGANADIETNGGALSLVADNDDNGSGALIIDNAGAAFDTADGNVSLFASDMTILGSIDAGAGNITIDAKNNRQIDLGTETTGELSLTDAELDQLSGALISIGSAATSGISVTSTITRAAATDMSLIVGNATIDFTGGSLNTSGGKLAITASGNGSIEADAAGTDIVAGQLALSAGAASGVSIGTATNPLRLSVTHLATNTAGSNGDQYFIEENTLAINGAGLDAGTGTIHFLAGGFELSADDLLADASSLEVDSGATFDIDAFDDTLAALALLNGTLDGTTGVLTSTTDYDIRKGTINAQLAGTVGLLKTTTETVTINSANTYSGTTNLLAGLTLINGSVTGAILVDNTATFGGIGTTGAVTVNGGGTVAPGNSPGILNTGDVTLNSGSTLAIEANGSVTAGTDYDQLNVTGTVTLGGATLSTSGTITSSPGQVLTIVNNDDTDTISGTFAGLAEGDIVAINGVEFVISYVGGSGNDVTLSQTSSVSITALSASINEGHSSTTDFTFTVTRTGSATAGLTVNYSVTGTGSNAANSADFGGTFPSGTLTFAANEVSQTLTIQISGDTDFEPGETFRVTLSSPSAGVSLGTATADGTIQNDDDASPVNTVPGTQTTDEEAVLIFSNSNSNVISVADADAGASDIQITLSITNGTLTLPDTTGLTFTIGDGSADTTMTFKGAINVINPLLDGLSFTPNTDFNGTAVLTINTDDLGATNFSGNNQTDSDSVTITVNAVNDGPGLFAPRNEATNEDTALVFNNANSNTISIADVDVGSNNLEVTLTATNGKLTLASISGLTFTAGDGMADTAMVFRGALTDLNTALDGMSFLPNANFNGNGTLDITVSDLGNTGSGGASSNTASVDIVINAINDVPTITGLADQTINEDTDTGTLTFSIDDIENAAASLTVTATSSNTAMVAVTDIELTGTGASRSIKITPRPDQFGTTTITLTVEDADGATSSTSFLLTVTATNDAPTITALADEAISEDTATSPLSVTINDIDNALVDLTLTAASSNTALVPLSNIAIVGTGATRSVTVTPVANGFGSSTITLTVTDTSSATGTSSFVLTVTAINDVPTITTLGNQTIDEDGTTGDLAFTVSDIETLASDLTITATSSDTTLIPNGAIRVTGTGANRSINVTPAANLSGAATITVTVEDAEGATVTETFDVTVNAVNDQPTITTLADQTIGEDGTTTALSFTVGDIETAATNITVSAVSSNPALIPNSNITFSGTGANRSVVVAPAANQFGTATITLTVTDADGGTTTEAFDIIVTSINDTPILSAVPDQTITEDSDTGDLSVTVNDIESLVGDLVLTGSSSNAGLVPNGNISITGTGSTRTLRVTPRPNQSGTATITLTIQDPDGGSSQQSFLLTVNAVNDAPTISDIADLTINEDQMTAALGFLIGDIDDLPSDLTISVSSSNTTLVPPGNIVVSGTGANRSVRVTPAANRNGTVTITITITDLNGLTASDSFTLAINAVNDPPLAVDDAFGTLEDVPLSLLLPDSLLNNDSDLESDPLTPEVVDQPTHGVVTINTNGTLTYRPNADFNGIDTFTYRVSDGQLFSTPATVTLTVDAINDAPQNNVPGPQTADEDTPLVFSSETLNAITVGDLETDSQTQIEVRLSVTHGKLTLLTRDGLTFTLGDGTDDPAIRMRGTIAALNAALDGLTYQPNANFNGNDALNITTIDQGGTANGGSNTDSDSIAITVNAVNDAPRLQVSASLVTNENQPLVFDPQLGTGIVILDEPGTPQAPNLLHVSLSVASGKLSLSQTTGLTFGTGDGTADSEMTFVGSLIDINAALLGAQFLPPLNADGTTRLTIVVDDQGNIGSGGALSASVSRDITVTAVPGIIRGFVWDDLEYDGLRNPVAEPGLAGVTVKLLDPSGNVIETTTTDDNGRYNFGSVLSDSYLVEFEAPVGRHFTFRNAGDERFDSDAHPLTGRSRVIDLNAGDLLLGIDAGLVVTMVSLLEPDPIVEGRAGTQTPSEFIVELNGRSPRPVTVTARVFSGPADGDSALVGQDLAQFPGGFVTVTFQPGQTQQTIRVAVLGDNDIEPDETFELRLLSAVNAQIDAGNTFGTIVNDDFATPVVVIRPEPETIEGQAPQLSAIEYEVLLLGGAVNSDLLVHFETLNPPPESLDGFATPGRNENDPDADYLQTSGTARIIAGRTSAKIRIPVIGDRRIEGIERVILRITGFEDPGDTGAEFVGPTNMLGFIIDDDVATPSVSVRDATVREGNSPFVTALSFPVVLDGPANSDITLNYSTFAFTTSGAATSDVDFTSVSTGTVTIERGQTVAYITIEVVGDDVIEGDETFGLEISSEQPVVLIAEDIAIGTILNDDFARPLVSVTHPVDSDEGRTGQFNELQFTIALQGVAQSDVTVTYSTVDLTTPGAATAAEDYISISQRQVVIPAGASAAVVSVTIIGDEDIEFDEDVRLRIDSVSGPVDLDEPHREASATIINDDEETPTVSLDPITTASETDAPRFSASEFRLKLSGPASTDITVYYRTLTGDGPESATEFFDFTPIRDGRITILAGQTEAVIPILILPDDVAEPPERFFLELTGLDGGATLDELAARAQSIIIDDDTGRPTVAIEAGPDVVEPNGDGRTAATFTVRLSSPTDQPVVVSYATRVDSRPSFASAGIDFEPETNGTVTIEAGRTEATIAIPVLGDDLSEDDEHFVVELMGATGGAVLQPGSRVAAITILDNDFAVPTVAIGDAFMVEGDPDDNPTDPFTQRDLAPRLNELVFLVTLNGPVSDRPVIVDLETNMLTNAPPGLANSDEPDPELPNPIRDFYRTSRQLVFDPGVTSREFRVRVVPDDRFEPDEIFFVRVTNVVNATLPGDVLQATGIIYNDDALIPTVSITDSEVFEGDDGTKFMRFRAALDADPETLGNRTITVDYATIPISAIEGTDYVAQTGTLTFAPGEREQFIDIEINGDMLDELDEEFLVELSNPTNGRLDIAAFQATGLIRNDDSAKVALRIDSVQRREGNVGETLFDFTVTRIGRPASNVTVNYATSDDTATTADDDYLAQTGTLTFTPNGPATQTITIRVIGDRVIEPAAETFFVTLTDAINASIDPQFAQGVGTILNDDQTVFREDGDRELLEIARQIQDAISALGNDPGNPQIQALIVQLSRQVLSNLGLEAGLVFIADPVDFLLTDTAGRTNGYTTSAGEVTQTPRSYYSGDGNVELVVIPQAPTGVYGLQLSGVGTGEYRTAATLVTADGGAKTIAGANILQGDVQLALDFTNTASIFPQRDNAIGKLADAAVANQSGKADGFVLSQEAAAALAMLNDRVDAASDSGNVHRLFFGPLLNSLSGMSNAVEQLLGDNFSESIKKWNLLRRRGADAESENSADDDASKNAVESFWKNLGKTLIGAPSMLLDIIDNIDAESAERPQDGQQPKPRGQQPNQRPAAQPGQADNAAISKEKQAAKSATAIVLEKQAAKRKQQEQEARVARWRFGRGKTPTPWDDGVDLDDKSSPWSTPATSASSHAEDHEDTSL